MPREGFMSKLGALGNDAKKALGALGLAAALHEGAADAKKIRTVEDVKAAATITDLDKVKATLDQHVGAPAPTLRDAGKTPIDTDDDTPSGETASALEKQKRIFLAKNEEPAVKQSEK